MKHRITLLFFVLALPIIVLAQPAKKTGTKEKAPTQADMNKMMDEAMKGMSDEEKAEMKKMMKGIMSELTKKPNSEAVVFTDNKKLVPAKDVARINSITKKVFTDADVTANASLLYSKLMAKLPASEKGIVTSVMAKAKNSSALMEAATISFMQGQNYAAMGLALKAVQAEPKNVIYQNNLAAILSQSGYPEKAIPYLKKLAAQFPSNSTVLHNLGYAWLQLGEADTARKFFGYAAARNPNNPETALCRGVIEELQGDPKKAADHYAESFEQAPNPFTEAMAKNVKADGRFDKIDFDKLKSRIAIYEYFKKDWIVVPALQDNVDGYESNRRIQNGYAKMFDDLKEKIGAMADASGAEVEAAMDKGETAFIEAMAKESIKGLSMMSMPAVYVNKILLNHLAKWQQDHVLEHHELMEMLRAKKIVMTKAGNNDKCPDYDRKNNAFLAYANPLIRKFHAKKIEEFRVWTNAYCTWSWYIAGNPKNTVLTGCISWTGVLAEMYATAIEDQYVFAKTCVAQNGDGVTNVATPAIPNFTCPAVVSIPFGLDELRLSADAINFDDNDWGIKKMTGGTGHNLTLAYGIDKAYITEPGKYGNPFAKTGNGSITPPGMGIDDLTPLSKIMDDLTPLDPALLDADKKSSVKNTRNAVRAKQLLNEMFKTECPGKLPPKKTRKERFEVGVGKLELIDWNEDLQAWVDDKGNLMYDKNMKKFEKLEVSVGELEIVEWSEELNGYVDDKGNLMYDKNFKKYGKFEVGVGELEFEEIKTSGLQTVINNGLEIAGTITSFIKGLFD